MSVGDFVCGRSSWEWGRRDQERREGPRGFVEEKALQKGLVGTGSTFVKGRRLRGRERDGEMTGLADDLVVSGRPGIHCGTWHLREFSEFSKSDVD